jgi:peptidoglycan/xylan/chitin deacetylase (PgdA/CDA1 family)
VRVLAAALVVGALAAAACGAGGGGRDVAPAPPSSVTTHVSVPASSAPVTTAVPESTDPAVVISRGDPSRRAVALTFDAGADVGYTAQILDTLAAARVRATFGLTGQWAEANPDLVVRIAAAGHHLVNHTFDHRSFTGVSARPAVQSTAERQAQLQRTEDVIRRLTGQTTKPWFRPPYGDYDRSVNADVGAAGYQYNLLWTVDSLGWQGHSASTIAGRCLERMEPGAIYLFHVGAQSQDAAALGAILAGLRDAGYELVTAAEIGRS